MKRPSLDAVNAAVMEHGPCNTTMLARLLDTTPALMFRRLRELEDAGRVSRVADGAVSVWTACEVPA